MGGAVWRDRGWMGGRNCGGKVGSCEDAELVGDGGGEGGGGGGGDWSGYKCARIIFLEPTYFIYLLHAHYLIYVRICGAV
jgi:hypothetical protein